MAKSFTRPADLMCPVPSFSVIPLPRSTLLKTHLPYNPNSSRSNERHSSISEWDGKDESIGASWIWLGSEYVRKFFCVCSGMKVRPGHSGRGCARLYSATLSFSSARPQWNTGSNTPSFEAYLTSVELKNALPWHRKQFHRCESPEDFGFSPIAKPLVLTNADRCPKIIDEMLFHEEGGLSRMSRWVTTQARSPPTRLHYLLKHGHGITIGSECRGNQSIP